MPENQVNPINPYDRARDAGRSATGKPEEAALLARVIKGDQDAMVAIYDRYAPMIYSVALRVLKDPGEAEDIVQEILVQVWQNPASFVSERGSFGAWLVVVARNRSIDRLRRRKPSESVDEVVLPATTNLANEAERSIMLEKVRQVLVGLPTEQQKSLELAFFEGLTHTEIAAKTGDPLGTVKTRIRMALTSLRKAMQS
ncbi:RNA polymerase sigma factor [Acidipila rosea]|uniref:RNA polymerase sigma-70 factor (ECF subfamily) n=1 Tax=Acidipila rosea TaxID=768535 RepID=A0A4R1L942_9BACT|nr:sigma-70 family RNA polymerase sigma factor [Acidipila rosea]MBW4026858.1 sigma-70 family RNA polymerase sigma factor [Acidobacteriota bacterium]MBW4043437.1 sigma-70 family RNA polymerase sigma factor [Acidobacteriota bacterium]TCK73740.1 RNA polymerase sigma-70 factor (ECF subfamily) [Acidipila rosea]